MADPGFSLGGGAPLRNGANLAKFVDISHQSTIVIISLSLFFTLNCREPGTGYTIHGNRYKDAVCGKLMEYANTLTAMIHAYIISTRGFKLKAAMLGKKTEIEADSYI